MKIRVLHNGRKGIDYWKHHKIAKDVEMHLNNLIKILKIIKKKQPEMYRAIMSEVNLESRKISNKQSKGVKK